MKCLKKEEIKQLELDLLVQFSDFCKKNNLYYTLSGGTLLGSIRHKGFIPWDDDIDVMMPRPDYQRLLLLKGLDLSGLPDYMKFQSWKDGTQGLPFIKLVDTRTRVSAEYIDESLINNRIWIDIFVLDGNPENAYELISLHKKCAFLRKLIVLKTVKTGKGKTFLKKVLKFIIKFVLLPVDLIKLCEKLDLIAQKYDFEMNEYCGVTLWGYGICERIHKKEYLVPLVGEFEGYFFNIPSNYDEYLSNLYHDYMKLPPVNQRTSHELKAYFVSDNGEEKHEILCSGIADR